MLHPSATQTLADVCINWDRQAKINFTPDLTPHRDESLVASRVCITFYSVRDRVINCADVIEVHLNEAENNLCTR